MQNSVTAHLKTKVAAIGTLDVTQNIIIAHLKTTVIVTPNVMQNTDTEYLKTSVHPHDQTAVKNQLPIYSPL